MKEHTYIFCEYIYVYYKRKHTYIHTHACICIFSYIHMGVVLLLYLSHRNFGRPTGRDRCRRINGVFKDLVQMMRQNFVEMMFIN